jgi:FkbM family methyltransferase
VTREDYWKSVKGALSAASELNALLEVSGSSLEISSQGLILSYPLAQETKLDLIVDPKDTRSIGVTVIAEGHYEPVLQQALLEISKECSSFLDIGANAGFYSIAVGKSNPDCRVSAFECNPKVRALFEKNVQLNNLTNIVIHSEGLSDKTGEGLLHVPAFTGSGGGSLQNLHPEEGDPEKFIVSLRTLDSLNLSGMDLIKIDVEGAELRVVKGAIKSIKEHFPTIFVELLRKWMKPFGTSPRSFGDLLQDMGYLIFEVRHKWIAEVAEMNQETNATNFVFVHESRPGHLATLRGLAG